MDNSIVVLNEQKIFITELLELYQSKRLLWDQHHPQYRNRAERANAYYELLQKSRQYYIEADEDFVKQKIESMRCSFRKERRKVLSSREISSHPKYVYRPSLWYYDLLLFTVGEEPLVNIDENDIEMDQCTEELIANDLGNNNDHNKSNLKILKNPMWCREYSAFVIDQYKKYPYLYDTSHNHYKNRRKRMEALGKIKDDLKIATGKNFQIVDIKRKIALLRGQYLNEVKKMENTRSTDQPYRSSWWCFEFLNFLDDYVIKKYPKQIIGSSTSPEQDEESCPSFECSSPTTNEFAQNRDDIYDTIARNVAFKLRHMESDQGKIAEKLIRDVLYHGQMGNLRPFSTLSLDGT